MPRYVFIIAAFFCLALSGCGGGGGGSNSGDDSGGSVSGGSGGSTSISASPAALTFNSVEDSISIDTKTITATFKGDGLLVGYPAGRSPVNWLIVNNDLFTQSPTSVQLSVSALGLSKGTYSTVVRLVTGKEDGTQIKYVDIPVTFNVAGGLQSDTNALSFSTMEGTQLPENQLLKLHSDSTPANWQIDIQYNDETKDWLVPSSLNGVLNVSDSSISIATKALPSGHYSANILLRDSKGKTRKNIPVTYDVAAGFAITGATTKNITEQATVEDLSWFLELETKYDLTTGTNLAWQITSDQPWLTVINKAGNFSANQLIQLQLSPEKLLQFTNGNLTANLNFSVSSSAVKSLIIPIQILLDLQPSLTITGLSSPSFYVGNNTIDSELKRTLNVQTNVGTAFNTLVQWQAITGASWLKLVNTTGNTSSNSTLQFEVSKSELANLANGSYGAVVTLKPDNARYKDINLLLNLGVHLATVEHVAPYVAYTGRSEPIVIRGKDFGIQPSIKVTINNSQIDATVVSDNEIRMNYPSLASEQRVNINIKNALNITRGGTELVYKNAPTYTQQKIRVKDDFYKINLDPERNAILLAGRSANEIGRVRVTTTGLKIDSFPAQYAQTGEVTLDGKEILVSIGNPGSSNANTFVHLNPETLEINKSVPIIPVYPASGTYDLISPLNDGRVLLLQSDQFPYAMFYPSQERVYPPSIYLTEMVQSRDRSRILIGSANSGSDNYSYDSNDSNFTSRHLNISQFRTNTISMSSDASRLVADGSVYDRDFNFLGSLSHVINHWNIAVSPNGKYAYLEARDMPGQYSIKRYNISAAKGPYPEDVSTPSITLAEGEFAISMKVSDDGNALFALIYNQFEYPNTRYLYIFPLAN